MVAILTRHMDSRRRQRNRLTRFTGCCDSCRELLDKFKIGVYIGYVRLNGSLHLLKAAAQRNKLSVLAAARC
ncbi:hypothetical protein D3C80_1805590 [compost metagenome]